MAEIFVRVHSPLFFCHFSSSFLQMRLSTQFILNCSLFTLSVQILITLSLSNCVLNMLGVQILVILSLFNCDLVTLGPDPGHGIKICVHALTTGSAMVNLSWAYSGFYSTSLFIWHGLCRRVRIFIQQCF